MKGRPLRGRVPGTLGGILVLAGLAGSAAAAFAASRGLEPAASWLYPLAWYPLLLAFEGVLALRTGRFLLLDRPALLGSVLAWSVPVWMLWELLNFRVANWYYVFVPERRAAFWSGVVVSFATVLPACFLPAAVCRSWFGDGGDVPEAGPEDSPSLPALALPAMRGAGVAMLVLPLLWPRIFFPLIWGAFVLLTEPDVHRAVPSRSLLTDVLRRRWSRIGALLCGGALAGLAWEGLNWFARTRWIYTVPGLEELKLFEMPPLGFLGFPALALSCWSIYQWLGVRGWAVPLALRPEEGASADRDFRPASGAGSAGAGAAMLVVVTLLGMESFTVSSRFPRLRDLPGMLPSEVEALEAWGVESPFALAREDPRELAGRIPGAGEEEAGSWIGSARLATTRGIGTRNARLLAGWGIESLEELARTDPDELVGCFRRLEAERVRPARVRVWWRGARAEAAVREPAERSPAC